MSDIAIRVENLSKAYRIGGTRAPYKTIRESFAAAVTGCLYRLARRDPGDRADGTIWALKDVTFEVRHGEVLGIIGRNGAGKSTLLKVLAHITKPSSGRAQVRGRVGSLLEVGTGFHPELTGRENIFLNGAILGMKRSEIVRKFDEIVAFAEMDKFLDTPVKRYSSGMYMRLAFSVAAHLDPEILLVDEVLAVGDAAFQKKCLGKMGNVARGGRTVLFVSHNMGAVCTLTQKCLYLQGGQLVALDESNRVVERYLAENIERKSADSGNMDYYRRDSSPDAAVRITDVWVDNVKTGTATIPAGSELTIVVQLEVVREIKGANLTIILKNRLGERVVVLFSWDQDCYLSLLPGQHTIAACVKDLPLAPGQYFADLGVNQSTQTVAFDVILDFPIFHIVNDGQIVQWLDRPWGMLHCSRVAWEVVD